MIKRTMRQNEKVMRTAGKAMGGLAYALGLGRGAKKAKKVTKKRRPRTAAEHKASVQQGKYMGTMHSLSKSNRGKVKAMRKKSGIGAAIKLAGKLARKK